MPEQHGGANTKYNYMRKYEIVMHLLSKGFIDKEEAIEMLRAIIPYLTFEMEDVD